MTYVENKRKELKTDYLDDTPEVGEQMNLLPTGYLGVKSTVSKKIKVGFE